MNYSEPERPPERASNDLRLAVLIDADNVPRKRIRDIMEEIAVYGNATIKRIYGDWTTPNLSGWKPVLLETAITPVQQYGYTTGKNSTDSAMIIDAMDILYSGRVDGFCIVSSDSDFTRLATRLREAGMKVLGFGEKKTPGPFIVSCDKFVYIEILGAQPAQSAQAEAPPTQADTPAKSGTRRGRRGGKGRNKSGDSSAPPADEQADSLQPPEPDSVPVPEEHEESGQPAHDEEPETVQAKNGSRVPAEVINLITTSITDLADEEGWAAGGELGTLLLKKQPDFDPRNFGFSKLTPMIKSLPGFEVDARQTNFPHIKHIYIRNRK